MQMLNRNPAAAYRRVALEARIEASGSADLTRICLEEARVALAQARGAVVRGSSSGREPLVRAHTILLWLARSVAPEHPLGASLKAFYGGLAAQIGAQIQHAEIRGIDEISKDISDVLEAAG
jgi:hypothetical protein